MSKFTRKLTSAIAPIVNTPGVWTVNENAQNSTALVITGIVVCDSGYNELDDTAVGTSGGYLKIKGTGFLSTATVYINGVLIIPTVTSSLELRIAVPTLTVGTYSLMVFNTATVGAIWAAGLVISGFPVWSTTTIATANLTVNTQLVASGDATLVYTLASGSLPPGVTLSSSGLLSGTISPVPTVDTVYNFTVDVKDAQNQNLAQAITFSLSVAYTLNKSLRFRSSASAYLNRTPAVAGNQKTWTWSGWVKRGTLSATATIFSQGTGSFANGYGFLRIESNDVLVFVCSIDGNTASSYWTSTPVYRDPAAWYHIVAVLDTTQGTSSNRFKLYVNGVLQSGTFSTAPGQNADIQFNRAAAHQIGATNANAIANYFDGELAEVNFVDGQALAPTSFGAFSTYNQWLPIRYAGTYGTNGFYLPFNSVSTSSYAGSFNGSNYLSVPDSSAFTMGSGDFTLEAWVYLTSAAQQVFIGTFDAGGNASSPSFTLGLSSTGLPRIGVGYAGVVYYATAAAAITTNTWVHIAGVRNGASVFVYTNGVQSTALNMATLAITDSTQIVAIGRNGAYNGEYVTGYISNVRIVKGTAVYNTAFFTPPISPLTVIAGTSLLTLQDATFIDKASISTITNNGTVVTSVQYPFTLAIAADSSGNSNNWTPNNISLTAGSTYDSLTDVPTLTSATAANYAVINAINPKGGSTVSNGNLTEYITGITGGRGSTLAMTSGKFYCEVLIVSSNSPAGGGYTVADVGITSPSAASYILESSPSAVCYYSYNGTKYVLGTPSAYGTAWSAIGTYTIGMALDVDAGTLQFYLNNVGQGNITLPTKPSDGWIFIADWESSGGSAVYNWNFGQQPWTYTPPANFLALNTYNI